MYSIVYVTTSSQKESESIGKIIVEEKLAACVNIIPKISSIYYWKNELQEDTESVLLLKTTIYFYWLRIMKMSLSSTMDNCLNMVHITQATTTELNKILISKKGRN